MGVGNGPPQCSERLEKARLGVCSFGGQNGCGLWPPPSLFLHNLMQLARTLLATVALVVSRQPWATCRPAVGWKYDSRTLTVSGTSQELSWERGPSS